MNKKYPQFISVFVMLCLCTILQKPAIGQTDMDAIMMDKKNLCSGIMFNYSSWKNYWEGNLKRENANIGKVSTKSIALMGNYGISGKLNILFGLPYVQTKASAGTLIGMKGLQDLTLFAKYMPVEKNLLKGTFSLYAIGGFSLPLSNYVADYLPLSIGLHSRVYTGRVMADYQKGRFFLTASGTYNYRNNIKIDRTAYYTTQIHLTNEVKIPDLISYNLRTGYRSTFLIAEGVYNNIITQGGYDIRKNDMPFPSNQMNRSSVGINIKYTQHNLPALSIVGGGSTTLTGRNVGQSTSFYGGIFYILDFTSKSVSSSASGKRRTSKK